MGSQGFRGEPKIRCGLYRFALLTEDLASLSVPLTLTPRLIGFSELVTLIPFFSRRSREQKLTSFSPSGDRWQQPSRISPTGEMPSGEKPAGEIQFLFLKENGSLAFLSPGAFFLRKKGHLGNDSYSFFFPRGFFFSKEKRPLGSQGFRGNLKCTSVCIGA